MKMKMTRGQKSWHTRRQRETERMQKYAEVVMQKAKLDQPADEPVTSGSTALPMDDLVMAGMTNHGGTHKVTLGFNALMAGPGLQVLNADIARQLASSLLAFAAIVDRYNGVAIPPPPQS